ncbi:MAG: fluoride efflux transporter CrcB [Salinivirgaceae bacterium]|nr:MAG: fluoride efflux transporter CrcB [Salinivirgaceae bacterium]
MIYQLFIIGLGGFLGSISRYMLSKVIQEQANSSFPWGTMAVNIIGSFIIGIIFALSVKNNILPPVWRNFLAIGFCGGFTTFSSFSLDNYQLLANNQLMFSLLYTLISVILGFIFLYSGILIVRVLT